MNILCRVDASLNLGTGHLMRCLALSQACEIEQVAMTFIIKPSSLEYCNSREDWVGEIILLPESLPQKEEIQWINNNVNLSKHHIFLIDGYQFYNNDYTHSKRLQLPIVIFDDNNDLKVSEVDMIINASSHAINLDYGENSSKAVLVLGEKFRVLRREFTELKQPIPPMSDRNQLTIIMGGSDTLSLTLPLLKKLQQLNIEMLINVITGPAFKDVLAIADFIKDSELTINHCHNCQNVAEYFVQSKLVISAAGGSQFELLACATPSLLVVVAENQYAASRQAEISGVCKMIDFRGSVDLQLLCKQLIKLWRDDERLEKMHQFTKTVYDGDGAENVIQVMRSLSDSYEYS